MYELFKAEMVRCRRLFASTFVLQFVAWLTIGYFKPMFEPDSLQVEAIPALMMIAAYLFGLKQMNLYKEKNNWTFLIQRPLSMKKIYLSLSASAIILIGMTVAIPWLIVVTLFDSLSNSVVDFRHYLEGIYLAGLSVMAYLMGSMVSLNPKRFVILSGLAFLLVVFQPVTSLWLVFVPMVLSLIYLLYINVQSFRANLARPSKSKITTLMLAIPMQLAIVFFISFAFNSIHALKVITTDSEAPKSFTYENFQRLPKQEQLQFLFQSDESKEIKWLLSQAELADSQYISTHNWKPSNKGQLYSFDSHPQFSMKHEETNSLWVFSHDEMLLQGTDLSTGKITGWVGRLGFIDDLDSSHDNDKFSFVPYLVKDKFILTKETLLEVDFDDKTLTTKFKLSGDQFTSLPQFNKQFMTITSTEKTFMFSLHDFDDNGDWAQPIAVISHPVSIEKIGSLLSFSLVDGFLLVFSGRNYFGFDKPGVEIFQAYLDGTTEKVREVKFKQHELPAPARHFEYMLSPFLYTSSAVILHTLSPPKYYSAKEIMGWKMPYSVIAVVVVIQVLSALILLVLSRRLGHSIGWTTGWVAMGGLIGIPALISFLCLTRVTPKINNSVL